VPADEVDRLLVPFQRLGAERVRASPAAPGKIAHVEHAAGLGLGLSIIAAIAAAHDAQLRLHPQPSGGLVAEVRFPASEVAATVTTPR
jgi:signal transduction histidine kinase